MRETLCEKSFNTYLFHHIMQIALCTCVTHSVVSDSVTPWTAAHEASLFTVVSAWQIQILLTEIFWDFFLPNIFIPDYLNP